MQINNIRPIIATDIPYLKIIIDVTKMLAFHALLLIFASNCSNSSEMGTSGEDIASVPSDDKVLQNQDTLELKVSSEEEDIPVNEYWTEALKPIRANFKKINSTTDWTSIQQKELSDSSEGGTLDYYFLNSQLQKIIAHRFGEMGQQLSEYYLMDGQLSFVFEKSYQYNRPMYYDSVDSLESQDQETFDFEETEIVEVRSYFKNGQLLHLIHSLDCGAPFAVDYLLEEQERIISDYEQLLKKQ